MVKKNIFVLFMMIFIILLFFTSAHAGKIEEFVLSNGLKVITLEEHKSPVVTFQVWYKVGSRNEITGKTGLSHLAEHMMFKGTKRYGKGEFSKIVSKNGGTENAFTSKDYTAYFENFASDRIELSLKLESDRMVNLIMDEKEFLLERDVVKEERRLRTEDDPHSLLIEIVKATAFLVHPYHSPVIGWMNDLNNLTRNDAFKYYKRYYVPNNATIIVVGDFDTTRLIPKIRSYFENIPEAPDIPEVDIVEPEQRGERRIYVKKEAELPFVLIGYRIPNYKSKDTFALSLLANILSSGKSSRLYKSIVYDNKIALDIGAEYDDLSTDPNLFYFYGMPKPEVSAERLEKAIYKEIERIKSEPVSDKEIQKAKNQVEASFIMGKDSNFYQAMLIGMTETINAGYRYLEDYVDNIREVTKEDIMDVAKRYLVEDKRTVGILIPVKKKSLAD
ncbi:MAG: M16 family metallopeptidase [Nitrospirota bacterium]